MSFTRQLLLEAASLFLPPLPAERVDVMYPGLEQVVEKEVSGGIPRLFPPQDQVYFQAVGSTGGSGHPAEIGLVGTQGNQSIGVELESIGDKIIQFPCLVAAESETGHIIPFAVDGGAVFP